MTIFRDDIGIWFFAMFLCLLAGKVWQWIGEGRVEFLEQQPPANPRLFHARLTSSLLVSVAFDIFMMQYCVDSILQESRPGVMVMFGFEYVLLAIASISTLLRYALSLVELLVTHRQEKARLEARRVAREQAQQRDSTEEGATETPAEEEDDEDDTDVPGWEEKGRWVFYLDLTTDFIKSVVYLGFFMILMAFYGIPIHIMRDLFMTIRSFIKRINDFVQYRNATRDMNARYPDATAEELGRENTCIVCREEMRPWVQPGADPARPGRRVDERQRAKKLPCGHILHFSCLRSWLERQQVCPTCRRPVLAEAPTPNNRPNNQANPGQQNQQNPPNPGGFRGLFPNVGNPVQRPGVQQGQPGLPGQQAPQVPQAQQGQQNRPVGNMRVFNFGPIRIALGNMRLPDLQGNNANNINNPNNNLIANLAQQLAQNPNNNPHGVPNPAILQIPNSGFPGTPFPGAHPHNPADIQSDILRLQQNIIDSLRHLNVQHDQLEYIHALLGELHRLQQASGIPSASGQELPAIAPLHPQYGAMPMLPQAYFARGAVLRQGDTGLPDGLVLPEGWTLRPMARAPQSTESVQNLVSSQEAQPAPEAAPAISGPSSSSQDTQPRPVSSPLRPSSTGEPAISTPAAASTSKPTEPSSLESSWSFGNSTGGNEGEGSSSAVAGSSSGSPSVTRRTATVEDTEDHEQ
jgi:E3 ubiquitin-protein ligase synoviolin